MSTSVWLFKPRSRLNVIISNQGKSPRSSHRTRKREKAHPDTSPTTETRPRSRGRRCTHAGGRLSFGRLASINVVGTCSCHPRQSTPPGVARACDALRVSGREKARSSRVAGLRLRRAGARAGGRDLKAGDTGFARSIMRVQSPECAPRCLVRGPMPCFRMRSS